LKKVNLIGVLALTSILVTGCGIDAMPDLTAEESSIISEYAAGLLLKYSPNYDYRIVDDVESLSSATDAQEVSEITESTESPETETETMTEEETSEATVGNGDSKQSSEEFEAVSTDTDLASVIGISDVSIKYDSYEICDSYPKDTTGFSVTASQGYKLLVVHFNIVNNTGSDYTLDLIDSNIKSKASYNENRSANGLSTLITNDLMSYYDTISTEPVDAVILFQISEESANSLNNLSIKLSATNGSFDLNIN
jgi:hypothetical protein